MHTLLCLYQTFSLHTCTVLCIDKINSKSDGAFPQKRVLKMLGLFFLFACGFSILACVNFCQKWAGLGSVKWALTWCMKLCMVWKIR